MDVTDETIKWLFVQRAIGFLYVSISVCVLYDHFTTLDEEIELVWKRPRWSMVQFLYMTNRYFGNVFQIYSAFAFTKYIVDGTNTVGLDFDCPIIRLTSSLPPFFLNSAYISSPTYHVVSSFFLCAATIAMHGIMILRVSSMYNHTRKIIVLLVWAFVTEAVVVLAILIASFRAKVPIPDPAPGVLMCVQKSFPPWAYTVWFPVILFDTLIFGLSLSLAVVYYKSLRHMANCHQVSIKTYSYHLDSLAYILLRDSITYPFISVIVCIANLAVWYYSQHLFVQMAFAFAGFVPCIFGPRLVLNLREAYYQQFSHECTGIEELELVKADDDSVEVIAVTGIKSL